MKKQLGTLLLLSGLATAGIAQEDEGKLTITGQMKNRTELNNGVNVALKQGNTVPGIGTGYRARVNFAYTKGDVKVVLSTQSIGGFDAEDIYFLNDNSNQFGMFEGYGQYTKGKATFKFGRQVISYGDQRILGGLDWAMSGRSHDGLVTKFALSENTKLDVGVVYNSNGQTLPGAGNVDMDELAGEDEGFQYLWLSQKAGDLSVDFLAMNDLNIATGGAGTVAKPHGIVTLGLMPKYKLTDALTLSASIYRQFGQNGYNATVLSGITEKSFMYNFDATYKTGESAVTLGFDLVSGDDEETVGTNEQFELFHGTHHKFYGFMDFFYVGEKPATGLFNPYVKFSTKLGKATVLAHLHGFYASKTRNYSEAIVESGDLFGNEVDLVVKYPVASGFGLAGGVSAMTDTKALRATRTNTTSSNQSIDEMTDKADNINSWVWLQANFTF